MSLIWKSICKVSAEIAIEISLSLCLSIFRNKRNIGPIKRDVVKWNVISTMTRVRLIYHRALRLIERTRLFRTITIRELYVCNPFVLREKRAIPRFRSEFV